MPRIFRPEAAEGIGVFLLMLAGGAAVLAGQAGAVVAIAFGGAVMVMIYALGHVSGAHFNPAITIAFAVTRHFPWRRVPGYVVAQVLGALAACLVLIAWRPLGPLVAHGSLDILPAFVVETLATFLLAFVIIAVATDKRASPGAAGLAIGGAVFLGAVVGGPLSGAAMNPARAIAPAVLAGDFTGLAATVLGPFGGAVFAMFAYEALRPGTKPRTGHATGSAGPVHVEAQS